MKALLSILLIILCGAGAYFSLQNKAKFETQIAENDTALAGQVKTKAATAEMKNLRDTEIAGLRAAKLDLDETTAKLETLVTTEGTLKSDNTKADDELKVQAEKIEGQKKVLEEAMAIIGQEGGDVSIDNIGDKIAEIEAKKDAQSKKKEELATLNETAEKHVSDNKVNIADLVRRKQLRDTKIASNAKEAVISAVNNEWGFVIIGAGVNAGFTPQTSLLVKRDGKLVGRITPTAIESNQTVADINLESIVPGASIQAGDKVVLANPARN